MSYRYAPGTHVLLDFYHARHLRDPAFIEAALRYAARACRATVLEVRLHQFGAHGGVTGMALLAESHISIHTWPERRFAALDVFMCGQCDARRAIAPLISRFRPLRTHISEHARGRVPGIASHEEADGQ